jgi:hypothetical protein
MKRYGREKSGDMTRGCRWGCCKTYSKYGKRKARCKGGKKRARQIGNKLSKEM